MKQTYLMGTSVLIMEGFDYLLQNKRLWICIKCELNDCSEICSRIIVQHIFSLSIKKQGLDAQMYVFIWDLFLFILDFD